MSERSRLTHRNPGEPPGGLLTGKWDAMTGGLLYKFLRRGVQSLQGIPGGFLGLTPKPVIMGVATDALPGTKEKSWMAADAQQVLLSGNPSPLGNAAAEGTSLRGSRQDHIHPRDVRVEGPGGADFIENAVAFSSDFTVTDTAPTVTVGLKFSAEDAMFYAHFLQE